MFKKILNKIIFSKRIWWLDILIPVLLCIVMFFAMSALIFSGKKNDKISTEIERSLIRQSLVLAGPRSPKLSDKIVIINITNEDLLYYNQATTLDKSDLNISIYHKLFKKIHDSKAHTTFIRWNPLSHPQKDYDILIKDLQNWQKNANFIFYAITAYIPSIPSSFKTVTTLLDSSTCDRYNLSICPFNPDWGDSIFQYISENFAQTRAKTNQNFISKDLPFIHPSYLLFLNAPNTFETYNVQQFMNLDQIDLKDKIVLIGQKYENLFYTSNHFSWKSFFLLGLNSIEFPIELKLKGFITPLDITYGKNTHTLTPPHIFWAQLIQLFIDDELVWITPNILFNGIAVIFAIFMFFIILKLGFPIGLFIFLIIGNIVSPFNAISIKYWNIYTPMFNIIYAGLSAFLFASFSKIATNAYYTWRLNTEQEIDSEISHLKGNFISLISHNLNTPISKMQGMIDILNIVSKDLNFKKDLHKANEISAAIQMCVKSVLVTTAVNEKTMSEDSINLKNIKTEFDNSIHPILVRFNKQSKITIDEFDELSHLPLKFDKRVIVTALGCLIGLTEKSKMTELCLNIKEKSLEDGTNIDELIIELNQSEISDQNIFDALTLPISQTLDQDTYRLLSIESELFIKLIRATIAHYRGNIILKDSQIEISLRPI